MSQNRHYTATPNSHLGDISTQSKKKKERQITWEGEHEKEDDWCGIKSIG